MEHREKHWSTPAESREQRASNWINDITSALQKRADTNSAIEHLSTIDLNSQEDRVFPRGEVSQDDQDMLLLLRFWATNEHTQAMIASLQTRRDAFMRRERIDIIEEQYQTLRVVFDPSARRSNSQ